MSQTTVERGTDRETEAQSEDSQPKRSPFERMGLTGTALSVANWLSVIAAIYVLITAVNVIGSGFKIATGDQAEDLFSFASNPLVGLMIGVVATALTQSSSTTTSVTVGMVAGGMPLNVAVPIIMGANLGTTLTNTLVSLGMVRDKEQFRRGFAAATVHDFFNLLAVIIFLPLEMIFGLLESVATAVADATVGREVTGINAIFEGIGGVGSGATEPLANGIEFVLSFLPETWQGIVMILVAIGLILLVINFIGKMLNILMVGQAKKVLHTAIGRGPVTGIASGTVITVMVQSSSTTTSLVVPLAGSGVFTLKQIYPFTLGANIGTTITALVSAFAFEGVEAQAALTAAMVHLSFNVFATLVIYALPFLRNIPPSGATWLANVAAERKIYAVIWAVGVFLVLPLILIFATTVF
ncbi:Na/Pi cotransporter family protein [Auritidibacter ignavus]|uniref:Na/Pi cotransporter family protein n=1 Tax=Auritidibacter ignavus TaxID=678932 RepID=UPI00109C5531|nr:Na/Pi cotransporter family protein [Auritidibacter ignavus]